MNRHSKTVIIGGGISGLTIAHTLAHERPEHRFLLLEKNERTGGAIRSHRHNDYLSELGPHGFLDNCPESQRLLEETGLANECIKAPLADFVRYVYLDNRLQCIPQTPLKILLAPLIPLADKFRVLLEALKPPLAGEPTVANWVSHRFGPALLPFADAAFTGTYAGDFSRLSIDAVMPGIRALEQRHGSVLRGGIARMLAAKRAGRAGRKRGLPAMISFADGMEQLPRRLTRQLIEGVNLELNCTATAIDREDGNWLITTNKGQITADNLVIATPVNTALQLLAAIAPELATDRVEESWLTTVTLGFAPGVQLPPGFGYLAPECEHRFALGTLFSSNMFPGRAPAGHLVFEVLIGGRRHPERLELDRQELVAKTLADIEETLQISAAPHYIDVRRSSGGIPQLEQGYTRILARRDALVRRYPGLHVCGFGWEGIGLNDMIKTASRVASAVLDASASTTAEAEVKKVYF
ncbi:MAG: protoporphyrinogen oxidase [Desulfopila sp.]